MLRAARMMALSLGLEQAGALRCEWSDRGEINPSESYLQVSVLGDAADDWATFASAIGLFQPVADAYGDDDQSFTEDEQY